MMETQGKGETVNSSKECSTSLDKAKEFGKVVGNEPQQQTFDCQPLPQVMQQMHDETSHIGYPQTMQLSFPINDSDFRSANPIQVSVVDGQVVNLMPNAIVNSIKKGKRADIDRLHEDSQNNHSNTREKTMEKSMTLITSSEKTYILPHSIPSEGDYLLTEEVLCEDILHSSSMLPEEQILTIPSPAVEFPVGVKPDALAIAASEVFSDNCTNLSQKNKCTDNSIVCEQIPEEKRIIPLENACEVYTIDSCQMQHPTSLVCDGANRLPEKLDGMSHSALGNTDISSGSSLVHQGTKTSKWYLSLGNDTSNESQVGSIMNTSLEEKSSCEEKLHGSEDVENVVLRKSLAYLQPPSPETASKMADSLHRKRNDDQVADSLRHNLRRSPRTPKVKIDPDFSDIHYSDEIQGSRKRRSDRGETRRALWDCIKCDAMFRTKASRNRHMQEGHLFTCYMCKWQGLTKTDYEIHISTIHCSQKARCLTCREDFPSYNDYRKHQKKKHPEVMVEDMKSKDEGIDSNLDNRMADNKVHMYDTPINAEDVDDPSYGEGTTIDEDSNKLDFKELHGKEVLENGKRTCPYCGKKFERSGRFIRHLSYHVGNKAFTCKFCQKSFVEKSKLEAHLLTHNPINEPCPQCGKIFKSLRTMKRHLLTHQNNLYTCEFCDKQFHHWESLRVHRSIHKVGGSGNVCSYCEKDCKTPYYLQLHMTNKHEAPKFICKICSRSFKWKQSYLKHMVFHNDKASPDVKLKGHLTFSTQDSPKFKHSQEKKYPCNLCGKWFRHEYTRDKHVKIVHHEEREHMCALCGALFKAKAYLDQHLAEVHTTKERVKCPTCGHDFKTESILKSHIKLVHKSTTGKYACEICGKTFTAPKDLQRHTKVHTGEKEHICPVCRRCFSRKDNMTSHLRTHTRGVKEESRGVKEESLATTQNNSDSPDELLTSSTQKSVQIIGLPSGVQSSSANITHNNFQPISAPSVNLMDSVSSLVSGSITLSALPIPAISLPSSMSTSLPNTVVYSNSSASSTCIVLSSKPSSSTLPVVVFTGSTVSNSPVLSNSQTPLSNVRLSSIHSNINDLDVNPPSTSFSNLSSVTTLTYCNNASLVPSSSNLYTVPAHPPSSVPSHLSLTPVSTNSNGSCVDPIPQDASVFTPPLHPEQIVLAEEVLVSTSTIS